MGKAVVMKVKDDGQIRIEKGVPCPPGRGRFSPKYPFADMAVGDSFLMPLQFRDGLSSLWGRHKPKRFTSRREGEFVRVWRIE